VLLDLIEKTKQTYVLLLLAKCILLLQVLICGSLKEHMMFLQLVVNFLGEDLMPKTHYILLILSI
jgi:hypothetical protein